MKVTELKSNNCSVDEFCAKCNIQFTPDTLAFFNDNVPVCENCGLDNPITISKETLKRIQELSFKANL